MFVILNPISDMSIAPPVGADGSSYLNPPERAPCICCPKWPEGLHVGNAAAVFARTGLGPRAPAALRPAPPDATMFEHLGFTYIGPIDGHSMPDLNGHAAHGARPGRRAVLIHVRHGHRARANAPCRGVGLLLSWCVEIQTLATGAPSQIHSPMRPATRAFRARSDRCGQRATPISWPSLEPSHCPAARGCGHHATALCRPRAGCSMGIGAEQLRRSTFAAGDGGKRAETFLRDLIPPSCNAGLRSGRA